MPSFFHAVTCYATDKCSSHLAFLQRTVYPFTSSFNLTQNSARILFLSDPQCNLHLASEKRRIAMRRYQFDVGRMQRALSKLLVSHGEFSKADNEAVPAGNHGSKHFHWWSFLRMEGSDKIIHPKLKCTQRCGDERVAVISAKNHKRKSVTAKREKSQTPKVLAAMLTLPTLT